MIFLPKKCVLIVSMLSVLGGTNLYAMVQNNDVPVTMHWRITNRIKPIVIGLKQNAKPIVIGLEQNAINAANEVVEDAVKYMIVATVGYVATEALRMAFESRQEKELRASEALDKQRLVTERIRAALKECRAGEDERTAQLLVKLSERETALEASAAKILKVKLEKKKAAVAKAAVAKAAYVAKAA
ncbi:hypothetical protein A3F06_00105 [candidate division TM6 bacterium RIFCSPHIGHO2_12_FULL_36_22]|nr:MAG: hypothetical protein A3F06_00105 [candidate division TM6 bacterium RIFCSPHIGHO2_12_FULL_36_22]